MKRSRKKWIERLKSRIVSLKAANRADVQTTFGARRFMYRDAFGLFEATHRARSARRLTRIGQLITISTRLEFAEKHDRWKARLRKPARPKGAGSRPGRIWTE